MNRASGNTQAEMEWKHRIQWKPIRPRINHQRSSVTTIIEETYWQNKPKKCKTKCGNGRGQIFLTAAPPYSTLPSVTQQKAQWCSSAYCNNLLMPTATSNTQPHQRPAPTSPEPSSLLLTLNVATVVTIINKINKFPWVTFDFGAVRQMNSKKTS